MCVLAYRTDSTGEEKSLFHAKTPRVRKGAKGFLSLRLCVLLATIELHRMFIVINDLICFFFYISFFFVPLCETFVSLCAPIRYEIS